MDKINILIAAPSASSSILNLTSHLQAHASAPNRTLQLFEISSSLVTWNFNVCWTAALNLKEKLSQTDNPLTHFLLIHDDVKPTDANWLDTLLSEMLSSRADVLSVIIPIKDSRGLTSTAMDTDPWRPLRITTKQAQSLPLTWTSPKLLVNTGLMLVDFRGSWQENVCFHMNDQIVRDSNNLWTAMVEPEDWNFSRQCHSLGLSLYATRAVRVLHFGKSYWSNDASWGEELDQDNGPLVFTKLESGELAASPELTEEILHGKG